MDNIYTQFKGKNPFASQAKMLFHGDRIRDYLSTGDCHPIFCEVNLTNICNLRCQWCISENFKVNQDTLKTSNFMKFARGFKGLDGKAITFSGGGEPTLHPDFAACVEHCKRIGLQVGLMTNGCYEKSLNKVIATNMQWVRISLDTLNHAHYKAWKGADHIDQVLINISALVKNKSHIKVGVNCNIHKDLTVAEVNDLIKLLDSHKITYLQFRPVIPRCFKQEQTELNTKVWKHLQGITDDRINYSHDKYIDLVTNNLFPFKTCEAHRISFVLNSNGDVCTCMYHPSDPRFVFGNIYQNTLKEIWQSQQRKDAIEFLRSKLNMATECQPCCKLSELNKLFENLKSAEMDVNFL
jgi:GTP 3',8-cyclase